MLHCVQPVYFLLLDYTFSLIKDGENKVIMDQQTLLCNLCLPRCLHSLSRSVQQLRTSFHDHAVWKPLMKVSC